MEKKIYYVLSSHWDREWYQAFQDFRYRLVGLFDQILHCQEAGELKGAGKACGDPVEITNGSLPLKLKPKQILTIRLS